MSTCTGPSHTGLSWSGTAPIPTDPYTKALELLDVPTLQAQDGVTYGNYTKLGLYRWVDPVKTDVIYHDGFRRSSVLDGLGLVEDPTGDLVPAQTV